MQKSAKCLLIGSTEPYSGKSATILGIAHQLKEKGLNIAYGKPLGTFPSQSYADETEEDVRFVTEVLKLPSDHLHPTLLSLDTQTIQRRLSGEDQTDYSQSLRQYPHLSNAELVLLEGPGTLEEGSLFDLSVRQMAQEIDAAVLLVVRFHSALLVDAVLSAQERLGNCLLGVIVNDIPRDQLEPAEQLVRPFLERRGIPVLGMLPRSGLLRSVSVRELVTQLKAEVICRPDRLDLMVESLTIGAMNVNSALKYFRKGSNMAVVTGGDRTDIQLAALETSTQCLILTGQLPPQPFIISRAEDLEIPILSVDLDTLTTVEIIDHAFGQVRLHEPIKVQCIRQLMSEYFDINRLITMLSLEAIATVQ